MLRRDLLIGGACLAAAGGAHLLRPSRNVALLSGATLADVVPATFGEWTSEDVGDPLALNGPGTLSAKLYNELLVRVYTHQTTSDQVLALLAYGGRQTDELQLHRPEICYPAFGYNLVSNQPVALGLGSGISIPSRQLLAESSDRRESVLYWSRIGEYLPKTGGEQRDVRFKIALDGVIPDGLLSRFSTSSVDPKDAMKLFGTFIPALILAVAPQYRKVLIGTDRAAKLASVPAKTA